jgi:hypothetical protein
MIHLSTETEARLSEEAKRQGISPDALLERLIDECVAGTGVRSTLELPIWHLGAVGPLRRRDIYDDVY